MKSLGDLVDAVGFQELADLTVIVVFGDETHPRAVLGRFVLGRRDSLQAVLVPATVADQHDVSKAVRLVAGDNVCQQGPVGFFSHTHRAGILHVDRGWFDVTLGDEIDDRGDQRVAQLPGDRLGHRLQDDTVLVGDEVGAVLLDSPGGTIYTCDAMPDFSIEI